MTGRRRFGITDIDPVERANTLLQSFRDAPTQYDEEYNDEMTSPKRKEQLNHQITEDRARLAEELQGLVMLKPELAPLLDGYKVNQFMELYKFSKDIDRVGASAFKTVGGTVPSTQEEPVDLDTILTETGLHPEAKKFGQQLQHYFPTYLDLVNGDGSKTMKTVMDPEGKPVRIKLGPDKEKDTVQSVDGKVLIKPAYADDPRLMHMVSKNMEAFLAGKETGRTGFGLVQQQLGGTSSKMIDDITAHYLELASDIDPIRRNNMLKGGLEQYKEEITHEKRYLETDKRRAKETHGKKVPKDVQEDLETKKQVIKDKEARTKRMGKDYGIKL